MLFFEDGEDLAAITALPEAHMCRIEREVDEVVRRAVAARVRFGLSAMVGQ